MFHFDLFFKMALFFDEIQISKLKFTKTNWSELFDFLIQFISILFSTHKDNFYCSDFRFLSLTFWNQKTRFMCQSNTLKNPTLSLPIHSITPSLLSAFIFLLTVLTLIIKRSLISVAVILLFCWIKENTVSFTVSARMCISRFLRGSFVLRLWMDRKCA